MARAIHLCQGSPGDSRKGARRERLSVDLRGYGPGLEALALSQRTSVAALLRTALADWLKTQPVAGNGGPPVQATPDLMVPPGNGSAVVKVTLRMPAAQATRLARQARMAELAQGAFVARLIDGLPVLPVPPDQQANRTALMQSTAVLAALACDLRALVRMLSRSSSPALTTLKAPATSVVDAVNQHLAMAAPLMQALAPPRRAGSVKAAQPDR